MGSYEPRLDPCTCVGIPENTGTVSRGREKAPLTRSRVQFPAARAIPDTPTARLSTGARPFGSGNGRYPETPPSLNQTPWAMTQWIRRPRSLERDGGQKGASKLHDAYFRLGMACSDPENIVELMPPPDGVGQRLGGNELKGRGNDAKVLSANCCRTGFDPE